MKILTFSFRKNFFSIIFVLFTILLVLFSTSNLASAKNGLYLWANNIIPALFPFFVATELLSHTNVISILGKFFNKFMKPLFNVPGEGSYPLIMGIVSGYPVGAKIVCDLRNKNILTKPEAERLLAFTNNSGPLFILASLTVGIIFRFWKYKDVNIGTSSSTTHITNTTVNRSNIGDVLSTAIKNSIFTILNIGGFIVLFSVIISIFNRTHLIYLSSTILSPLFNLLHITPEFTQGILNGFLEITNGLQQISSIPIKNISFSIIICAFILGFGGISVLLQVYSFTAKSDVSIKSYILGKFLQGLIAAFYTFLVFHFFSFLSLDLSNIVSIFEYL